MPTTCDCFKRNFINYHDYMATKSWEEKKIERLKHDGYQCQICGSGKNLTVHHITYDRLGAEDLDDIITVCKTCHDKIHAHD